MIIVIMIIKSTCLFMYVWMHVYACMYVCMCVCVYCLVTALSPSVLASDKQTTSHSINFLSNMQKMKTTVSQSKVCTKMNMNELYMKIRQLESAATAAPLREPEQDDRIIEHIAAIEGLLNAKQMLVADHDYVNTIIAINNEKYKNIERMQDCDQIDCDHDAVNDMINHLNRLKGVLSSLSESIRTVQMEITIHMDAVSHCHCHCHIIMQTTMQRKEKKPQGTMIVM
jgi:hypothetical protein